MSDDKPIEADPKDMVDLFDNAGKTVVSKLREYLENDDFKQAKLLINTGSLMQGYVIFTLGTRQFQLALTCRGVTAKLKEKPHGKKDAPGHPVGSSEVRPGPAANPPQASADGGAAEHGDGAQPSQAHP